MNFPEEVDRIRSGYRELAEIMDAGRGCSGGNGRSLAALANLIEVSYEKNGGAFSLVMNADILLDPTAGDYFADGGSGVTMIPRWLVDASGDQGGAEKDPWGYDGARLGPELRGLFTNRSFGLGLPWWDYWIPFRALYLGHPVQFPDRPLAFHVRHEEQWDEKDRARLAGEVWREVGVPPWKRFWRKHLGPRNERKNYGYHNHLAGHVRETLKRRVRSAGFAISGESHNR